MKMKKISLYILLISTALMLGACGKKEEDSSVSSETDVASVSVSDKTSAAEEQYTETDPEILALKELESVSFGGKYRLYNVNSDKLINDSDDYMNESRDRFIAFVITEVADNGKETIVARTIGEPYPMDIFTTVDPFIAKKYDPEKLYNRYLESRKAYVDMGYSEDSIHTVLTGLLAPGKAGDAVLPETRFIDILFQFILIPGATTRGADFVMPASYSDGFSMCLCDLASDGYPEVLVKGETVDIVLWGKHWMDSDIFGGVGFINPDEGILYDRHDEFNPVYYQLVENGFTVYDQIHYSGYHEEEGSDIPSYVLELPDGTEKYIAPDQAHIPGHGVKPIDELNLTFSPLTPLNIVKICEHLE